MSFHSEIPPCVGSDRGLGRFSTGFVMVGRTGVLILMLALSGRPLVAQSLASDQTGDTGSLNRGQQISSAVATVTGVSVSPLVGVCVLGAWEHYRTPKAQREKLPLYTRPVFWIPIGV